MNKGFEDEFLEMQSQMISLCIEFAENRADKIYAYGSIEENSISFNAFFNIDGEIKTTNQIAADTDAIWDFLELGETPILLSRQKNFRVYFLLIFQSAGQSPIFIKR